MMPNMHGLDVLRNVASNYQSSFVVMLPDQSGPVAELTSLLEKLREKLL